MANYDQARQNMVDGQLRPNQVLEDGLLTAMRTIPRELFVPQAARGIAYIDEEIPLGQGRFLMEPLVFGKLLQAAGIRKDDVVLDIGCATGYSTAVLAHLAATVVAIESDADFVRRAGSLLDELGVDNAVVMNAPLPQGFPENAPYDVITLQGAVADVPQSLLDQLAEGGRLIALVAKAGGRVGQGHLYQRIGGIVSQRALFDATSPYLVGFEPKPAFDF